MNIRDRIRELRRVPASELRPSPLNWRTHSTQQLDALRGILAEVGYAGAALARELPDGTLELIDGHARVEVSGTAMVPVLVLDVDEAEARKILATYDPIGAMAGSDAAKLDALLRDVQTGNQALAGMLEDLAEKAGVIPEPETLDELPDLSRTESHTITIRYRTGDEQTIKMFIEQHPNELLDPIHTGKRILERIKEVVAVGADLH